MGEAGGRRSPRPLLFFRPFPAFFSSIHLYFPGSTRNAADQRAVAVEAADAADASGDRPRLVGFVSALKKDFGFLEPQHLAPLPPASELFFHFSDVPDGAGALAVGMAVSYDLQRRNNKVM